MVTGVLGITAFPSGVGQNWDSSRRSALVEKPVETPVGCLAAKGESPESWQRPSYAPDSAFSGEGLILRITDAKKGP
jgi:hypothetical protein